MASNQQDNNDLQNAHDATTTTNTAGAGSTDRGTSPGNVTGNDVLGGGIGSDGDNIKITEGGITDVTGTVALGGSSDVGGTTDAAATADVGATTGAAGLDASGTEAGTSTRPGSGTNGGDEVDVGVTGIRATGDGGTDVDAASTTSSPMEIDPGTGLAGEIAGGG